MAVPQAPGIARTDLPTRSLSALGREVIQNRKALLELAQ
jgi:hypothetical protein